MSGMLISPLMLPLLLGILLAPGVHSACNATYEATEKVSEAVVLKFYQVTTTEWMSNGNSDKVAVQVSNQANSYCAASPATCGVQACCSDQFKESSVGTNTGYPKTSLKDIEFSIYLQLPSTLTTTGSLLCMVSKGVLRQIVADARQSIYDDTGYWITYIDDEFYGIPPDHDLNRIIIPIACVVLLGIIITAFALHFWNKKREALARRQKILDERKKGPSVQPTYNVDPEDPKPPKSIEGKNSTVTPKPKRKDQLYKDNLRQGDQTKRPPSDYSEDSAIKVDTDPRQRQAYQYERQLDGAYDQGARGHDQFDRGAPPTYPHLKPLQREVESDDVHRSPEKKKKKKKKRSKSKEPSGTDNDAYASTDRYKTDVQEY